MLAPIEAIRRLERKGKKACLSKTISLKSSRRENRGNKMPLKQPSTPAGVNENFISHVNPPLRPPFLSAQHLFRECLGKVSAVSTQLPAAQTSPCVSSGPQVGLSLQQPPPPPLI